MSSDPARETGGGLYTHWGCELMKDLIFKQNLEHVLRDMVTDNAVKDQQLRENRVELTECQQQLKLKVYLSLC